MRFLALMVATAAAAGTAVPARAAPCAGEAGEGRIRVTVEATGVRDARGEVAFTVYPDQRARFLKRGTKLARVRTPAQAGVTSACFWLAPGAYPFAVYHDANGDRNFNRTLFVPKEGYGFSNDAPATFGLPSFDKVRITVAGSNATVRIRMRYP